MGAALLRQIQATDRKKKITSAWQRMSPRTFFADIFAGKKSNGSAPALQRSVDGVPGNQISLRDRVKKIMAGACRQIASGTLLAHSQAKKASKRASQALLG